MIKNSIRSCGGSQKRILKRKEKKSKIEIGAAFLIHYENYSEISQFVELMHDIGIDFVHIRPVYLREKEENQKVLDIINKALALVRKSKKDFENEKFLVTGITRKMEGVWFERTWNKCYAPFFLPVLGANGKLYACCDRRDFEMGDFTKDGFAKIYKSKEFKEKVREIQVKSCARCTKKDLNEVIYYCFEKDGLKKNLL